VVPFRNHLNSKYSISSVDSFKAIVLVRAELYLEREAVKTRYADVDVSESVKNYVTKKCLSVVDELMDEASRKFRKFCVLQYAKSLNEKYPIAKSTDAQLAQWLPELLEEMNTQKRELRAKDSDEERDIIRGYIREVKNLGISAYERLEKLNKKLFKSPEIQAVVQEIDPSYEPPSIFGKLGSLFDVVDISGAMDRVKSSFSDMFNTNIFKK
jgi:hypothetical protein